MGSIELLNTTGRLFAVLLRKVVDLSRGNVDVTVAGVQTGHSAEDFPALVADGEAVLQDGEFGGLGLGSCGSAEMLRNVFRLSPQQSCGNTICAEWLRETV